MTASREALNDSMVTPSKQSNDLGSAGTLEDTQWDVVVVGGGMVGAAVALGLAQRNFQVLVLEKSSPSLAWREQEPYRPRVSALTRASETFLKNLGVWNAIESRRFHAFTDMHVWETVSSAELHFSAESIEEDNLGYVIENDVIQAALWQAFEDTTHLSCITGHTLESLTIEKDQAWLILDDGRKIATQLIVGADGAFSQVRELAGIGLDAHPYQQAAIVGCVETEQSHQNTCWQRYREEGPFAFLPMEGQVNSIAWYMPEEKMDWALGLSEEAFAEAIEEASGGRLGKVTQTYERSGFPLVRRHAQQYVKPRVALVGDAAHTIHPQAGQGVNLGFLDAAALIEVLETACSGDDTQDNPFVSMQMDCGRIAVLRRYERWRRADNALVQKAMEGFDWLFEQDAVTKNRLREAFLTVAEKTGPMKRWLTGQALYGREPLPALVKSVFTKE